MSQPSYAPDGSSAPFNGFEPVNQRLPNGGEHAYPLPDAADSAPRPQPTAPAVPAVSDYGYVPRAAPVSSGPPNGALVNPTLAMPSAGYTPSQGPVGADAGASASASPFGGHPSPPVEGGPASGVPAQQPYPGAPMSGVPYGQATTAAPMSGVPYGQATTAAPMSGVPYGQATTAAPMSGVPYGAPTTALRGKSRMTLVLGLVAVLLFVLSGVMTGLFVATSSELTKTEQRVSERDAKLDASAKEIDGLKRDLQAANDKVKQVEQDLTGTKNDRDEQARQKQVIAKCLDLFGKALSADNRATFEKFAKEADKACNEADKYL